MAGKIKFNTKHLIKGDPLPPFKGKLRVYNMRYCPFAHRVILTLNAKKIDYEIVNINLMSKPDWYNTKSSFGKVPALEIKENVTLCESVVMAEYLDDAYPQRPLLPKDPVLKAYDKIIVEASGALFRIFIKSLRGGDVQQGDIDEYNKAMDFIQEQLKSRGTKFLDGEQPGFADYMIWPWFERILAVMEVETALKIDPQRFKLLLEYLNKMEKDPVVSEYLIPRDIMQKFCAGYKNNPPNPDYNLLPADD